MDPLFSLQDSTGGFDFGGFGAPAPQDASAGNSNPNAWFQNQSASMDTPKVNGKPMFDLSSAISGFDSAVNGNSAAQSNSLNQLLSQHLDAQQQQQQQPAHHPQSQLAALFADDPHFAPTPIRAPAPAAASHNGLPSLQNVGGNGNGAPSMFVATLVDPNQEGARPQQMLFLPGTNQVIPMSGANEGQLLNLADMPVVFQPNVMANGNNGYSFAMQQQQQQNTQVQQAPAARMMAPLMSSAPTKAEKKQEAANMPVRPLSAYNFFFSDERERILKGDDEHSADTDVYDDAKKQRLLLAHIAKDRTKRRPHRKTHGKINFTTLSKLIGQRWRQLSDDRKNFYRQVAAIDLERYQRELRERGAGAGAANSTIG